MSWHHVFRKCGHWDAYQSRYVEDSKNWNREQYFEKQKLCLECFKGERMYQQVLEAENFEAHFPPPPKWMGSTKQVDYADEVWRKALGAIFPTHPQFAFALAVAESASERPIKAREWLDAWDTVRRYWPKEPPTWGFVDLPWWFSEALGKGVVLEAEGKER